MSRKLGIVTAALAALIFAAPTWAQTVCGERTRFLEQLGKRFKEAPAALGVVDNGSVLELLTSRVGSWTILVTAPDGTTCMVASGENWEDLPKLTMGPKA